MDGWEYQIVDVAEKFVDASPAQAGELLRQLHAVLSAAPAEVNRALGAPCRASTVDALLDAEAPLELAYRIAGPLGLLVSRFPDGRALATVSAPALFGESEHENASVPLAIGGALIVGLVSWSAATRVQAPKRSALN